MPTDDQLIEQFISDERTADPHLRNEPTIKGKGTPVWAVAGYCLQATGGSTVETAKAYNLTELEVKAALVYYYKHKEEMDARMEVEEDNAP